MIQLSIVRHEADSAAEHRVDQDEPDAYDLISVDLLELAELIWPSTFKSKRQDPIPAIARIILALIFRLDRWHLSILGIRRWPF